MLFLPFGKRAPGLDLDTVLAHECLVGGALEERMGLDLVDRRGDVVVFDEVHEPVGVEVRHADGLGQTFAADLLHRSPGAVVVAERLVDEVQVHVVEAEPLKRRLERALCVVLAGLLDPELGGDEQFAARDAAAGDGLADGYLVLVGGGGVERAVAGGECVRHRLLCLLGGDLVDAEAECRHLDAVVEGELGDLVRHDHRVSIGG
jgi:hypothetical protein